MISLDPMVMFVLKLVVYALAIGLSGIALRSIDFNVILKKNRIYESWLLYFSLCLVFGFLVGTLINFVFFGAPIFTSQGTTPNL